MWLINGRHEHANISNSLGFGTVGPHTRFVPEISEVSRTNLQPELLGEETANTIELPDGQTLVRCNGSNA